MTTLSHRELRNRSGDILRAAASGESFTITNDGTPVARLVPLSGAETELRCVRPRRSAEGFTALRRHPAQETVVGLVDELRGDR